MALTDARLDGSDLHVVRAVASPRLDERLVIRDDTSSDDFSGDRPPPHVTVAFEPGFLPEGNQDPGSISGHGIPFCPVCRYVLVELIDPTKHGIIDGDYAKIYPDPRL